jgi:hypothetical protein
MKSIIQPLALVLFTTAVSFPVWSDEDVVSMPPETTQGDVSYVTGGIGQDEAALFEGAASTYPLQLQFVQKAEPVNQSLADVEVTIQDRHGTTVLDATSDGPFLLASLPSGKYRIKTNYNGNTLQKTAWIHHGQHLHIVFLWPAAPADAS